MWRPGLLHGFYNLVPIGLPHSLKIQVPRENWILTIQFDDLSYFFAPVLFGFSPTWVHPGSTAFLVVILKGHEHDVQQSSLMLFPNFDESRFRQFEVQFCIEKKEKIDAINWTV